MADSRKPQAALRSAAVGLRLPLPYRLFFLLVEPCSALAGAYYAHFAQRTYLELTDAASLPVDAVIPRGGSIVLDQLANLYLFFALAEGLVLRSTADLRVWRALLLCMLVADAGHLYSVRAAGAPEIYWSVGRWNAIDWGNIPFVYLGASMRIAFLAGIGLGGGTEAAGQKRAA